MTIRHTTAEMNSGQAALGPLPEWDLADLYPGRDSPELTRDLAGLGTEAAAFRARYQGRLGELSGDERGAAVAWDERLEELACRIISDAHLQQVGHGAYPVHPRFNQALH